MSFTTLLYHEIRERLSLRPDAPSPIKVKQNYSDLLPSMLFVTLENFEAQMLYLYEQNYHTLTLPEVMAYYYNDAEIPEKSVLITFDDCYQSLWYYAYPVLKKYNFNAVAFVVTGWLNDEPEPFNQDKSICLTTESLKDMGDVFEYANHTHDFHIRLNPTTNKAMVSSDLEFSEDLDRCNANTLITSPQVFAYTFGLYNDANIALLKEKKFKLAFTSANGTNTREMNPLLLKRTVIPYFMDLPTFKTILNA
ncbi:Chitin deacetylase [Petrocella atlantisensis]|uniref:Chitin deacetylase n=1 Tax=Petrocella atlantisensis TaxID=2173034 RepID=A0A3P7PR49_9FIRM|nr:polysaccharide deacetylase family protein [Petrocella atlantisensis]VDN46807.1 Chitin deacetylase [Petrocella atlantisensis]